MKAFFILILSLLLLNFNSLYSQTWPKYYGQTNRIDRAWDIFETYDKGYLILGNYPSFSWLIKTDINGNVLWEKIIDNEPNTVGTALAIEPANDGGIIVCGIALSGYNNNCPYVMKLNACGEKVWCKIFEGSPNANSWAQEIKETETGDFIVLVVYFGSIPEETIHLFKLNANGEVLWQEPFATTYNYPNSGIKDAYRLSITENGSSLISGRGFWKHPWNPDGGYYSRPMFIMVDSTGNEEWVLPFGLNDTIIGIAKNVIEFDVNKNVSVGGRVIGNSIDHGLLLSFDNYGNELGFTHFSFNQLNPEFDKGTIHYISQIDSLYLLASFFGNSSWAHPRPPGEILLEDIDFDQLNFLGYKHYTANRSPYEIATLSSGKYLSTSTYPHSSTNYEIFLAKLNLNLEYDTAYTGNFTYDSLCIPGPPQSGFIYLNDCDIVLGTEMPTAAEYRAKVQHIPITIYPNPAKDHVTFALENTEHHRNIELRCFNLLGMQQYQTKILRSQQQASANVSNWPPGMYIAVVYSDGKPVGRGKFVVQ